MITVVKEVKHEKCTRKSFAKIGDYIEMVNYLDKLKQIDPRNPYVIANYERANQMVTNQPSII